jgi:hypothetical protein
MGSRSSSYGTPFRKDRLSHAKLGFFLLDRPLPFSAIRCDAVLPIRLQGLDSMSVGSPDTQADAAAFERPIGRIEIGGDRTASRRCFRANRTQMRFKRVDRTVGNCELQLDLSWSLVLGSQGPLVL